MMKITRSLRKLRSAASRIAHQSLGAEPQLLTLGRLLSMQVRSRGPIASLGEVEFKVFSQWGDDGIIQWLVSQLDFPSRTFVEFGVGDYRESNTRFLMMNDNWSGLVMDGSEANVARIQGSEYYWQYELTARCAFIDRDNIESLLAAAGVAREPGILHIDLDGNDYWIWQRIQAFSPVVVILEYNAVFGDRPVSVPYDAAFQRTRAHFSNLYFGASLAALHRLSAEKGYAFIGCNSAGNNAYFVRRDHLNDRVREVSLEAGFVDSRFRESRDPQGALTYLGGDRRIEAIRGLPVVNVATGAVEAL